MATGCAIKRISMRHRRVIHMAHVNTMGIRNGGCHVRSRRPHRDLPTRLCAAVSNRAMVQGAVRYYRFTEVGRAIADLDGSPGPPLLTGAALPGPPLLTADEGSPKVRWAGLVEELLRLVEADTPVHDCASWSPAGTPSARPSNRLGSRPRPPPAGCGRTTALRSASVSPGPPGRCPPGRLSRPRPPDDLNLARFRVIALPVTPSGRIAPPAMTRWPGYRARSSCLGPPCRGRGRQGCHGPYPLFPSCSGSVRC